MSDFTIDPSLTSELAREAAAAYGWSVLPHDNGGFFARRGHHRMIVTFDECGVFRYASVREGLDGSDESLMEGAVVGALAMYGAGPVRSGEESAALSPGQVPPEVARRYPPEFIERINQPRRRPGEEPTT
jgi:hypothetical protein